MVQIAQLLDQRSMSFSFCLNKADLLVVCGTTLLYQVAELKQDSKLTREVGRLIGVVIKTLGAAKAPGSLDLERVARWVMEDKGACPLAAPAPSRQAPPLARATSNKSAHTSATGGGARVEAADKGRRMTMPVVSAQEGELHRARCRPSLDRVSLPSQALGMGGADAYLVAGASRSIPNLDYLSLSNTPSQTQPPSPTEMARMRAAGPPREQGDESAGEQGTGKTARVSTSDWEALLGSMDGGVHNVYDAIYGGASLINDGSLPGNTSAQASDWSQDSWDPGSFSLCEVGRGARGAAQSVLSMSDESLSSGEEVAPSELGLSLGSVEYHKHAGRSERGDSCGAERAGGLAAVKSFSLAP